ncbi:MAG: transposase, partial [Planctomycetota bacterium]
RKTTRPKSLLGKAVGYFLNQWDALCYFTGDGRVAIDNNRVERQMRCVAVGRKNWLFAGSEEAAIGPLRSTRSPAPAACSASSPKPT